MSNKKKQQKRRKKKFGRPLLVNNSNHSKGRTN